MTRPKPDTREWEIETRCGSEGCIAVVACLNCGFGFDAAHHPNADGSFSCPNCEETRLRAEVERLGIVLREIAKGAGPFSRDPLIHAENAIEAMKALAIDAIESIAADLDTPETP